LPYFYLRNLQGDVVGIADTSGTVVASYTYDAWGNILSTTGSNMTIANANPIRYRGYYWDAETGYYFLQTRYYSPEWRRFINSDCMFIAGDALTGSNMYGYCDGNPVMQCDPWGMAPDFGAYLDDPEFFTTLIGFYFDLYFNMLTFGLFVKKYDTADATAIAFREIALSQSNQAVEYSGIIYKVGGGYAYSKLIKGISGNSFVPPTELTPFVQYAAGIHSHPNGAIGFSNADINAAKVSGNVLYATSSAGVYAWDIGATTTRTVKTFK
jgi:RHS repeat-associated protein